MRPYLMVQQVRVLALCVGLALAVATIGACGGGEKAPESAFYEFLRFVPDRPAYREYLTFGDAAAWHASWGVPRIDDLEQLFGSDPELSAYWMYVMPGQTMPPSYLLQSTASEDQRGFYGFDLFNLDRYLIAGNSPDWITVAGFGFDAEQIGGALAGSGYQAEKLETGGMLYSIGDDYRYDLNFPTTAGRMGDLNRIVLLDGEMVIAKATELVTASLAAHDDQIPSLADDPEYIALAQALDDPALAGTGQLMGVIVMDDLETTLRESIVRLREIDPAMQRLEERLAEGDQGPHLPAYSLVAFATRHTEGATYLILAVVFPQGTDGQAAADLLADRLRDYVSLASERKLMEMWEMWAKYGASLEKAVAVKAGGLPVALVLVRIDDPAPAASSREMSTVSIPRWVEMVARRDLGFLWR